MSVPEKIETEIVHALDRQDNPLCGFTTVPYGRWPQGHTREKPSTPVVTCPQCIALSGQRLKQV